MSYSKAHTKLDGWVELTKNIAIVLYAVAAAYAGFTRTDIDQFYWVLILIGGGLVYALYLPYKYAAIIEGEWGLVARVRIARTLFVGIPAWIILAYQLLSDSSIAQLVPSFLSDPSSVDYGDLIFGVLLASFISASIGFGITLDSFLKSVGYDDRDSKHLTRYLKSRGVRDVLITSFIIFYCVSFIVSGWVTRGDSIQSSYYFTVGISYIVILILYGFFSAWYVPERYDSDGRILLELLLVFFIVGSPPIPYFAFGCTLIIFAIIVVRTRQHPKIDIFSILTKEDEEKQRIEEGLFYQGLSLFYKQHKNFSHFYYGLLTLSTLFVSILGILDFLPPLLSLLVPITMTVLYIVFAFVWLLKSENSN